MTLNTKFLYNYFEHLAQVITKLLTKSEALTYTYLGSVTMFS